MLTVILRPNFEDYMDTAKQLEEKKITLYFWPDSESTVQFLLDSAILEYRKLGENAIIADDYAHMNNITKHDVLGAGTHATMTYFIDYVELGYGEEYHPDGRGWYRSKEIVSGRNPYAGYVTNKKWHLNEVLSKIKYSDILISILTF